MTRRQVLVQLDDDLVNRLDELASTTGVSRSELLRRGGWAVLEAANIADADRKLVESYRRTPQEAWIIEAAGRMAAETAPDW